MRKMRDRYVKYIFKFSPQISGRVGINGVSNSRDYFAIWLLAAFHSL